jgi:sigma-B regulation protein RsbU (phosphoserine phosphatase)
MRQGGQIERIDTMNLGFPIGLDDDIDEFISYTNIEIETGDGVVFYTDEIPEVRNLKNKQYGIDRLCTATNHNLEQSSKVIKATITADMRQCIGQQKVFDDITLLVLKSHNNSLDMTSQFLEFNCSNS